MTELVRLMQEADLAAGARLTRFAGWNQTEEDWQTWLNLSEARAWVTEIDDCVVGSATAIPYEERFGWVGMVLVDPEFRRQGVATSLVRKALHYLERKGCTCQKLDATPEGKEIYERLGFQVEYEVERWRRLAQKFRPEAHRGDPLARIQHVLPPGLEELDRRVFGASRRTLLKSFLAGEYPGYQGGESAEGYGFARPGRKAAQVGPLVALNPQLAEHLMERFLQHFGGGEMIADVVAGNENARILLQRYDFFPVRHLLRMFRGPNAFPGRPAEVYCLAGFEWG
jgi:GNAT superfamily N-acetyltransferase